MKSTRTTGQIIRSHTLTYFNLLNVILAGLIVISGQYKNMLFMGVVVANSLIGIVQELKVKKLIDSLTVITATKARLVVSENESGDSEDGRTQGVIREIPIEEIQPNNILEITNGDQLAVDARVLVSEGLEINESMITGESVPVLKKEGDLLYSGTFAVAGTGRCEVLRTGEDCYAAKLTEKARTKKRASSEMQEAIRSIIRYVSYAIIPIGLILFCIQYFRAGNTLSDSLVGTVAGVLGMIPEGLVLLTSVSFILGVGRLARKRALVQEMEAIEALARTDVLCLDKTGTITTGELTVDSVIPLEQPGLFLSEHEKISEEKISLEKISKEIEEILNGLVFAFSETNATTDALQAYFHDTRPFAITDRIPFSSSRKYMGVTFEEKGTFLLGAPEFLTEKKETLEKAEAYEKKGYRVLLLTDEKNPLALILLSDQIKEDAAEIFDYFASQNVSIKLISGDSAATVSAVGQRAGIRNAHRCINAGDLSDDPEKRQREMEYYTVFGRVSPEQKQEILEANKKAGHVTAMVGDGVNDVLALKDADCGIAMANGAAAARQTAHIVLMDSDFSAMKNIVKEGRIVIANIERVSALYLTKTIYSVLLCICFILLGKNYPFIPIQLTLIGATAIGLPSFILALESDSEVSTGGFLRHVLRISLPAAIGLTAILLCIQFLAGPLRLDGMTVSTLNLLTGGVISLGVVGIVCHPMNRVRMILCIGITLLFFGAFFLFPGFFQVRSFI